MQFWDLTLAEIYTTIEAYNERQKQNIAFSYYTATFTISFLERTLNKEPIPTLAELLNSETGAEMDSTEAAFLADQWKAFADKYNKQRREAQ